MFYFLTCCGGPRLRPEDDLECEHTLSRYSETRVNRDLGRKIELLPILGSYSLRIQMREKRLQLLKTCQSCYGKAVYLCKEVYFSPSCSLKVKFGLSEDLELTDAGVDFGRCSI